MSPPYAATELAKTRRGQAPRTRMASISRSEPWKLTRIPRSKFRSASPLTTAARWNTTPVSGSTSASAAPGSLKSPMRCSTRGSAGGGASWPAMSLTTMRSISCSAPSGPASAPRFEQRADQAPAEKSMAPGDEYLHAQILSSSTLSQPQYRTDFLIRTPICSRQRAVLARAASTQCRLPLHRLSSPCDPLPRHPDARSCRTSLRHCGRRTRSATEPSVPASRRPRHG